MLAPSYYAQWSSRFIRYVDTKANKNELSHCIESGPYILTELVTEVVPAIEDQPGHLRRVEQETYANTTPENRKLIDAEVEAIHMILNGIGDDIYLTLDACSTAREMWLAIEHLQQRESINKLFDILKQHQNEVNEIRAEKNARNANPLALVAAAQHYPDKYSSDTYYQVPKPHKTHTSSSRHTSSTSSYATTRNKSKEIAKPITPPSESPSEEDSDPEQAQRYKDMQKNLALIAKYIKNIYKPTNNNLRTSSNTKNKTMDTSPRSGNDKKTRQFGNQRTVTVARARETVGNQVVQQTGIQCFNCKEYGHFAKGCRKPKRAKDYAYHKEKNDVMQTVEERCAASTEHGDWLADTDEESDEQKLEAHYMYMAKIHEVPTADLGPTYDAEPLEKVHSDDDYNVFVTDKQHSEQRESINDTYVVEMVDSNVILDSSNMCDNEE
ncbi:integrase, catalytic region, zinc finger, CCHC-type containing protein [Tanacetum coccineum]|uniref:Integrase, catalytic region, zinc finger, CCHC-type containing protein n=1 Tax=Tanacetum coccineum TaxID=301880 RepID=A0ABQ5AN47_9ASTR